MKNALIVGGSRGIGLGLVKEHLARGWRLTVTRRGEAADLEQLAAADERLALETLEVTDQAATAALADRLAGQTFDLLFLNAGIMRGRGETLAEIDDGEISDIFMTNAIAPVRVADALAGSVAKGGTVAFMSSILGSVGGNEDGRAELYRASKAALNSLVKSFRARHARGDLTVLALHPGVVRTSMGGPSAPLDIETSVKGVADVLAARQGKGGVAFLDYRGQTIPW